MEETDVADAASGAKSKVAGWARGFKHSGVKKLFVIGCVPNLTENYPNLQRILGALEIGKTTFFSSDYFL